MRKIYLILLVFSASAIFAQQVPDSRRMIEVTGTSELEVGADELYITITLLERMEGKDKIGIEKQESDLKKAVKDLGVDLANLSLNNANADYKSIRKKNKDVLISKNYTLKIYSTDQLSKLFDKLDQMNAYDAYVSRYTNSKIADLQKENRVKAIKAAKEKSDYLLAALGQQTGSAILILETENYVQDGTEMGGARGIANVSMQRAGMSLREEDGGSETISFKKIKIRSSYLIKFEITGK